MPIPVLSTREPIFRVARKPDPWRPSDWAFAGEDRTFGHRFDDSEGYFRVLYAGSTRLGCFIETLARFRKGPVDPELELCDFDADHIARGTVPATWLTKRCIGQAKIDGAQFAHVYHSQSVAYYGRSLNLSWCVPKVLQILTWLCLLMSRRRWLTQEISTLICSLGYDGIAYQSRHGSDLWNWAIFEPFNGLQRLSTLDLSSDDPDFKVAMQRLDLAIDIAK